MNMIYMYTIVCTDHCLSIYLSYIISFVIYHTIAPSYDPLTLKLTNLRNMSLLRSCCISCITWRSLAVADSRLINQSVAGKIYCAVGGWMSQYFAKNRLLGQTNQILIQPSSCSNTQHTAVLYYRPKLSLSNQCSVFVFKFWCYLLLFQSAWLMFHLTFLDILVGKYLVSLLTGRILLHILGILCVCHVE